MSRSRKDRLWLIGNAGPCGSTSRRGGACGQCETNVISCDGTLEHNDHFLEPEDKASGRKIMICVSRLKGQEIVLDL